jgi:hypothetical protein
MRAGLGYGAALIHFSLEKTQRVGQPDGIGGAFAVPKRKPRPQPGKGATAADCDALSTHTFMHSERPFHGSTMWGGEDSCGGI